MFSDKLNADVEVRVLKKKVDVESLKDIKSGKIVPIDFNLENEFPILINGIQMGTGQLTIISGVCGIYVNDWHNFSDNPSD